MGIGGLWVTSFIYKYEKSTTYPLVKPHDVLAIFFWSHCWLGNHKMSLDLPSSHEYGKEVSILLGTLLYDLCCGHTILDVDCYF